MYGTPLMAGHPTAVDSFGDAAGGGEAVAALGIGEEGVVDGGA